MSEQKRRFHGDWAMKEASQNMSRAYCLRAATEKNHIPPWWQVVHEMWLGVFRSSLESRFYDVHPMARFFSSASRLCLRWDDLAETPQGWKIVQLQWCFAYVCMGFGGLEEKVGICILVSSSDMLATGYRHACHSMLLLLCLSKKAWPTWSLTPTIQSAKCSQGPGWTIDGCIDFYEVAADSDIRKVLRKGVGHLIIWVGYLGRFWARYDLKEVWLRSASLLWYIHRIPMDPLVCGFVIMVIYNCPCHQMPDGLKFFFTDLHLQPAMARVWANHGLV